ncbi:hypothetical protein G3I44_13575 [Halogeometricum borinquense]|uniref:Uncharacterized protein n=1 Tax=Halogeometricum borinquense TaxID=60847 RepID=A0A6C0UKW8_9EURY|nr:hypothetical protein [Halogeometricum borinquense]QIB75223.1 hypothetical protein G3I44_13575 [Halogeometricum borinquense]
MSNCYSFLEESGFDHVATVETDKRITSYLLATTIELFYLGQIWISIVEGKAKLMMENDAERVIEQADSVEFHDPAPIVGERI